VTSRSIPADGYNSAPRGIAPPLPARAPSGVRINSTQQAPREIAPPLPARAPPVRINSNQQGPYGQVQHQSYPDSTTYRGAGGYGDYREVTHHYGEDEEGEVVGGFQGGEYQGRGEEEDEEAQEQEPEPEEEHLQEEEEEYRGGEPVENEEEQGYNAHNYGNYGADHGVEEGEEEDNGGYGYQASRRW